MNALPIDLTLQTLRDPETVRTLSLPAWDLLVRQARRADLMGRIAHRLAEGGLLAKIPAAPRAHLQAARQIAEAQHEQVRREVGHIVRALGNCDLDAILLKGSAYVLAQAPPAAGRMFSDIDILVPHERLPEVEASLMLGGWATMHQSDYDQRYYRQWMHELPPLVHIHRQTVLDVHHAILPRTARLKPDSARLIAAARPLAGHLGVRVLAPVDMVLHSIAHLVHNEELSHGLRDLSDIDLLLRDGAVRDGFWPELLHRARELDLARPLHYGLRAARRILATPVPADVLAEAARAAPAMGLAALMDALWLRALRSPHASAGDRLTPTALFMLYLRAHWLRMPAWALARHLTIKALRRKESEPAAAAPAAR